MRVTTILKGTEQFYTGFKGMFLGWNELSDEEKLNKALRYEGDNKSQLITTKIGNGQFNTKVELYGLLRKEHTINYELQARRGYKLAIFEIN